MTVNRLGVIGSLLNTVESTNPVASMIEIVGHRARASETLAARRDGAALDLPWDARHRGPLSPCSPPCDTPDPAFYRDLPADHPYGTLHGSQGIGPKRTASPWRLDDRPPAAPPHSYAVDVTGPSLRTLSQTESSNGR